MWFPRIGQRYRWTPGYKLSLEHPVVTIADFGFMCDLKPELPGYAHFQLVVIWKHGGYDLFPNVESHYTLCVES